MKKNGRKTIGRFIATLYRMGATYLSKELSDLKIGPGQYIFLAELFDKDGQSQDELTQRVNVDKANTARALKKLEDQGYVKRISDEKDKRIKRVYLQPSALEIEDEFWKIITGWSGILTQNIPQFRQDQLMKDLKEMTKNASTYLNK